MAKETTTFGLSSKKLVNLLKIAEETGRPQEKVDQNQKKTELLQDYLAQTLEAYKHAGDEIPAEPSQLRNTINILSSEPIGKLLQDPETDIDIIRIIKDYSSKFSKRAKSKAEHQIANTIYYAAIAHALLFHSRRITRYTYESLSKSFAKLTKENWIPNNISNIFVQATKVCQQKIINN
jgi:hypothetical protein